MTLEETIIAIVRIIGSLPVLWWPFVGGILAVLVDFSDLFMMNLLNLGGVRDYQTFDKVLDLVYMVTFLIVSLRWKSVPRNLAIGLFSFRIVGVVIFELIAWRGILLFFPNVFEFWVLFMAGMNRFKPEYEMTGKRAALWMVPLLAVKEFQEYALHGAQWLDNYRAVDVVVDWWYAVTGIF